MAVAFRSVSTAGATTQSSPLTITKPAGAVDADVLICHFYVNNTSAVTPPAGWNIRADTTWSGQREVTATKLCSGEGASYDFAFSGTVYVAAVMTCYSGCDASSASAHFIDAEGNSGTGTTATGTQLTTDPTRAGSMLIWHAISGTGARSGAPTPGSWSNRATFDTNMYADDIAIGAGPTGSPTSAYPTSQTWVVHLLGLQPAESGEAASVPMPVGNTMFFGGSL